MQKHQLQIIGSGVIMFTSLNEKILQFGLYVSKKTFKGNFSLFRVLLIIFLYLPFYFIFQLYMVLFFSDELFEKVMRNNIFGSDKDLMKVLKLSRSLERSPKLKNFVKVSSFFVGILRILGKWLKQVPIVCLAVGLIQMMEYEVTLDSVRNIDFKIIERSIEGRNLSVNKDVEIIKNTIDSLTTYSGWVLFPVAILTSNGCFENGSGHRLCKRYTTEKEFLNETLRGDKSQSYDVSLLLSTAGHTYMFSRLTNGQGTLIGEAGAYSSSVWGRAAFIEKIPYYLSGSGIKKMYSKSKYIWFVISVMVFILIFTRELALKKNRKRWLDARLKLYQKDGEARKALEELNEARMQSQMMMTELEQQRSHTESLKQNYNKRLEEVLERERESEEAYFEILESFEEQELISKKLDTKLTTAQSRQALEETRKELTKIKRLWTHDYGWNERFDIESEISSGGNSPFIRNVSFIGFERFIKNLAQQKLDYTRSDLKSYDGPGVIKLIDELEAANMISKKDKTFFHEVRIARNNWMHEGKLPSQELLKRLVVKLDKVKPKPQPAL